MKRKLCLLTLVVATCAVITFPTLADHMNQDDMQVLIDFYQSTQGEKWSKKDHWLDSSSHDWFGVTLSSEGRVVGLKLGNSNLVGSIPASLGDLSQMTELRLSNNYLSGAIPDDLGKLSQLMVLSLSNNQLSGSIPVSLGNLIQLSVLYLGYNQLSGSIPEALGNLGQLTVLGLSNNQLSGVISMSLGNLARLEELNLSSNQLSGTIPATLGNLNRLTTFDLSSNQLSGPISGSARALLLRFPSAARDNPLYAEWPVLHSQYGQLEFLLPLQLGLIGGYLLIMLLLDWAKE